MRKLDSKITSREAFADIKALRKMRRLCFAVEERYPFGSSYRQRFCDLRRRICELEEELEAYYGLDSE